MTGRRAFLKIATVVLLVGLVVAPVVAGRTVRSGDTIYAGEEGLNFVGFGTLAVNQTAGRLVHYTDYAAGVVDKVISIANPADFELTKSNVGTIAGSYYVFPSGAWDLHPENAAGFVEIQIPRMRLDVVLNAYLKKSVDSRSATQNEEAVVRLANNLNTHPSGTMVGLHITLPGSSLDQEGGVLIDRTIVTAGVANSGIVPAGTYTVQAKWPEISDYHGKNSDRIQ